MPEIHNDDQEKEDKHAIKPRSHLKSYKDSEKQRFFDLYKNETDKEKSRNALFLLLSDKKYRKIGFLLAKKNFYYWEDVSELEDCVDKSIFDFFMKYSKREEEKKINDLKHFDRIFWCFVKSNAINAGTKKARRLGILEEHTPEKRNSEKGGEGLEPPLAITIVQDRYPPPKTATIIKQYERILTDLLNNKKDSFCSGKKDNSEDCSCVIANYVRTLLKERIEITPEELKKICECSERNARNWRNGFRKIVRKKFDQYRKIP